LEEIYAVELGAVDFAPNGSCRAVRSSRRSGGIYVEDSSVVDTTGKGGRKIRGGGVLATAQLVTDGAVLEHGVLANASLVMVGGVLATAQLRCCGREWR
jgi:hypothetical protein